MAMIDELVPFGIDVNDAMERFAGSMALYEKMLKKLPENVAKLDAVTPFRAGDYGTALANAHTMKGLTGNLSITPLFNAYNQAVTLFRAEKPMEAGAEIEKIIPLQNQIVTIIAKYL